MRTHRGITTSLLAGLIALAAAGAPAQAAADERPLNGTVWVANRGAGTIRGFDAASGDVVATIAMREGSQSGDLAFAKGKLYVAEEFGSPPAIAIVDASTGAILGRINTGPRPHHVHANAAGGLVAYGVFGTNKVGIIDARTDTLLGEWPASTFSTARSHAGVFSPDGRIVYVANDVVDELAAVDPRTGNLLWTMTVPKAHEIAVTANGKTAYVSSRAAGLLQVIDLTRREIVRSIPLGPLPDTLRLSANEKVLTVGLRGSPAQVAIVDTATFGFDLVTIGGAGTIAGHQWTSPSGRFTFAAFEGTDAGVAVIDLELGGAVVQTLTYAGRPHGVTYANR